MATKSRVSAKKSSSTRRAEGGRISRTGRGAKSRSGARSATSKTTTDHDAIRGWAEEREGKPTMVKATRGKGRSGGLLRIDFPGFRGENTLQRVSWSDFFRTFDQKNLVFLYQDKTASGRQSRFHKFIDKESAGKRS
jgi:hypothetical protein